MAIKAWTDLTSVDTDDFEALGERQFSGPQLTAAKTATDEAIEVKDTLCASLHFIPRGNLTNSANLAIRTAISGGGTLLECTETTGALTTGQVRVSARSGKLEFHADQLGATLYATYTYRISNVDEALIAQMYNAIRRMESGSGIAAESFTTGELVVAGPGYISGGLVYQCDPTDITKAGWVWIVTGAALGATTTIYRTGKVTPRRSMPVNTPIYAGHGGDVTWEADTEEAVRIQTGEFWHCIGISDDGITLNLNTLQDARRQ